MGEQQTCGEMVLIRVGHAYEHFDQSDYDTAVCGLPIRKREGGPCEVCGHELRDEFEAIHYMAASGYAVCAECMPDEGDGWWANLPADHSEPFRHEYDAGWEHVAELFGPLAKDGYQQIPRDDIDHEATPAVREEAG